MSPTYFSILVWQCQRRPCSATLFFGLRANILDLRRVLGLDVAHAVDLYDAGRRQHISGRVVGLGAHGATLDQLVESGQIVIDLVALLVALTAARIVDEGVGVVGHAS